MDFKSVRLLKKLLAETPKEELQKQFEEVLSIDYEGPTVEQYFQYVVETQYAYFLQMKDMTHKEKVSIYRKLKKEQLIEMLISANNFIDILKEQ